MLQRYKTTCQCGNAIEVSVKVGNNGLQIYCQCGKLLVEYLQDKAASVFDSLNDTFQAAEQESDQAAAKPGDKDVAEEMTGPPSKTGRQFGDYTIIKKLGEGGMGKVYLVHNNSNGEKQALKVLQKIDNADMIRYFIREAQILSELDHPNIVKIKGQGNHNRRPYIAMEYVIGKTLAELVAQSGPLRPVPVAQVIVYVLRALEYAAQKKIIHRDIKPHNIFLTDNGVVKLIDLGLSKAIDESYQLSKTGKMAGTPFYMPLEQMDNAKCADYRSDIYAVGATMFHLLCGQPPYLEYANDLYATMLAKTANSYIRLTQRNSQLPAEIVKIVEKAMAHDPAERYATACDMKLAIIAYYKTVNVKQAR